MKLSLLQRDVMLEFPVLPGVSRRGSGGGGGGREMSGRCAVAVDSKIQAFRLNSV